MQLLKKWHLVCNWE